MRKITQPHEYVLFWPTMANIGCTRDRDTILLSKSIYSSRRIEWRIHKYQKITHAHNNGPFSPTKTKIKSINVWTSLMILESESIYSSRGIQWGGGSKGYFSKSEPFESGVVLQSYGESTQKVLSTSNHRCRLYNLRRFWQS